VDQEDAIGLRLHDIEQFSTGRGEGREANRMHDDLHRESM
jgi:hypothetical protein